MHLLGGPGSTNMVTGAAVATTNRRPCCCCRATSSPTASAPGAARAGAPAQVGRQGQRRLRPLSRYFDALSPRDAVHRRCRVRCGCWPTRPSPVRSHRAAPGCPGRSPRVARGAFRQARLAGRPTVPEPRRAGSSRAGAPVRSPPPRHRRWRRLLLGGRPAAPPLSREDRYPGGRPRPARARSCGTIPMPSAARRRGAPPSPTRSPARPTSCSDRHPLQRLHHGVQDGVPEPDVRFVNLNIAGVDAAKHAGVSLVADAAGEDRGPPGR